MNSHLPRRPYAKFIGSTPKGRDIAGNAKVQICMACHRNMEELDRDKCWICGGCGKRIPYMLNATTNKGGRVRMLDDVGLSTGSGGGNNKPVFIQPKNLATKDWYKRTNQPQYDADERALLAKSGVKITYTQEIKGRPDTITNDRDLRSRHV